MPMVSLPYLSFFVCKIGRNGRKIKGREACASLPLNLEPVATGYSLSPGLVLTVSVVSASGIWNVAV